MVVGFIGNGNEINRRKSKNFLNSLTDLSHKVVLYMLHHKYDLIFKKNTKDLIK
jgi:hypothetical protein